jgi:glycosyltransferase involved in cell wall biosynthesis
MVGSVAIRLKDQPVEQMRIALFTETFIPKVDGIVTTLCQTVKQLRVLGHDVLIFAPEGGFKEFEHFRIAGMKSRSFALYPELRLALPRASMRTLIAEFQPDILHVADPALLGIAGLYYGGGKDGGALRLPTVVSYHTDLPQYLHYYGLGFLEKHVWKILRIRHNRATMNLCTSVTMVDQLQEHGIERVALWPGGVDADLFHPSRRSTEMRSRLTQNDPKCSLLLCVGRLSAEKNLESLRPILEALPNVRLALVGDGPHRKTLERHFAGLPVFMPGFLHGADLAAAYASSDVFVMPSRTETLGLVVLEAMSSGLPVVAARAGGIPEMIHHGHSGFLFDKEAQAVDAIGGLLHSKDSRECIGKAAREHASKHSWKAATILLIEHYKKACETQNISVNPSNTDQHRRLGSRTKKAFGRATLFTIRKLLP